MTTGDLGENNMWKEFRTQVLYMAVPVIIGVLISAAILLALPWIAELFDCYELWVANLLHTAK